MGGGKWVVASGWWEVGSGKWVLGSGWLEVGGGKWPSMIQKISLLMSGRGRPRDSD